MTREPDLIREIVLEIERADIPEGGISIEDFAVDFMIDGYTPQQVEYHYGLVYDYGYLRTRAQCKIDLIGLSNAGHDYADKVRDPMHWNTLKTGALAAGGFTFELLTDLAKGFIKKKVEALTDVPL